MKQRIASLLASATEITCVLGLEDRLVAISHECDYPPGVLDRPHVTRPRFDPTGLTSGEIDRAVRQAMAEHGSVYAVDTETLERLRPDLVLTQGICEVCAVPVAEAQAAVAACGLIGAEVLSLDAHTIEDIFGSILAVGRAAGVEDRARRVVHELKERLARVERAVAGAPRPRVLAIEWLDPPFAPGHWVPQMVDKAGGVNLIGQEGRPSYQVAWEDLRDLDPDVLVLMPCGFDVEAARQDADRYAAALLEAAPRAIEGGRAFVVDGSSYFNRSGPRVVDGVEILAALLHPDRLPPPPPAAAQVWRP